MKKKLSVALFSSLMLFGLAFSSAVDARPPHTEHPGWGTYPPPCHTPPCPIPT